MNYQSISYIKPYGEKKQAVSLVGKAGGGCNLAWIDFRTAEEGGTLGRRSIGGILSNASGKRFPEGFTDAIDDDHSMGEFWSCTSWWDAAEAPGVSRGRGPAHT